MKPNWEAFGKNIMRCWPEGDVDGGELQDTAVKYGVLKEVPYSIERHGIEGADEWGIEEGEPWYERNYHEAGE